MGRKKTFDTSWVERNKEQYQAYQRAYHANLRATNPQKYLEYARTGLLNGTRKIPPRVKFVENKETYRITIRKDLVLMNYNDVIANVKNGLAHYLFVDMRSKRLTSDNQLSQLAIEEGYVDVESMEAALLNKANEMVAAHKFSACDSEGGEND